MNELIKVLYSLLAHLFFFLLGNNDDIDSSVVFLAISSTLNGNLWKKQRNLFKYDVWSKNFHF